MCKNIKLPTMYEFGQCVYHWHNKIQRKPLTYSCLVIFAFIVLFCFLTWFFHLLYRSNVLLRDNLFLFQDVVGFNLAGLQFMQRKLEAREVTFFNDTNEKLEQGRKKRKTAIIKYT